MLHLVKTRRFMPLCVTQFLGAMNDNIFKNALVILVTFKLAEQLNMDTQLVITASAGLFILPFFIFSATAGQVADKFEKSKLIRIIKTIEIILMSGAIIGFYLQSLPLLLVILFLMGTQSTFFGPLKFSILPDHLQQHELMGGNALIEATTFISILLGTIIGGLVILLDQGILLIGIIVLCVAISGRFASSFIPKADAADPTLPIQYNIIKPTFTMMKFARNRNDVFLSILGISWFWFVGVTLLTLFPLFAKDTFGANEQVVTLFLTVFALGVGIGSFACDALLKGKVDARYVWIAALVMGIGIMGLCLTSSHVTTPSEDVLINAFTFIQSWPNIIILCFLLFISIAGGIYIVPLYTLIQARSNHQHLARILASNNIFNALFMVLSSLAIGLCFELDFAVTEIFWIVGIANLPIAWVVKHIVKREKLKNHVKMGS
tara:strand:+ start:118 stop:1422 length:1305 start_codon:yes stop_codon:yes gene_type:complete